MSKNCHFLLTKQYNDLLKPSVGLTQACPNDCMFMYAVVLRYNYRDWTSNLLLQQEHEHLYQISRNKQETRAYIPASLLTHDFDPGYYSISTVLLTFHSVM